MDAVLRLHRMWLSSPSEGRQAELHGAPLNNEKFEGTDLRRLLATEASFRESRFYDVDLSGSELRGAQFYRARLHHSNLSKVNAREANFAGARLDHCDFSGASLAGAIFFRAELNQCIFRDADLQGCDFREMRMRGGDFRGANLGRSTGLSAEQIARAIVDQATTLP